MSTKSYLGDGVYVELDRGMIKLTTEDGEKTSNEIYLEAEVYHNLQKWANRTALVTELQVREG